MQRTTIVLPEQLKQRTMEKARADGISFSEFVRRAVELAVNEPPSRKSQRERRAAIEAMREFRDDALSGGPADLAINIDKYVYGASGREES
jgi:metal-responsive CopG/Arc/MetJ family transcriptional regulator